MTVTAGADFQIRMSVDSVVNGTKLARSEIAKLAAIQRASKTDADRLTEGLDLVERALKAEQITAEQAAKAISHLNHKYGETAKSAKELASSTKATSDSIEKQDSIVKSQIVNIAKWAAGIVAARATIATFKEASSGIDEAFNVSQELGDTVNNVRRLSYAIAEMSGIETTESVNAIRSLSQAVGLSAMGIGKDRKIFQELGVDVQQLAKQLPTEQFKQVAKAIQQLETPAERAAIAAKLFGQSGVVQALSATAEEFDAATAAAARFVLPISDADAAAVESMNDEIARAQQQFYSMAEQIVVSTEPAITSITAAIQEMGPAIKATAETAGQGFGLIGAYIADLFDSSGDLVHVKEYLDRADEIARRKQAIRDYGLEAVEASEREIVATQKSVELTERKKRQLVEVQAKEVEAEAKSFASRMLSIEKEKQSRIDAETNLTQLSQQQLNQLLEQRKQLNVESGLSDEHALVIAKMEQELQLQKDIEAERKKALKDQEESLKKALDTAESIRRKLETPADVVERTARELNALVAANALSVADAQRELNRVITEQSKTDAKDQQPSQVATLKLSDANTFKQLAEIQNKQQNNEQRMLFVQQQSKAALDKIVDNTAAFRPMRAAR